MTDPTAPPAHNGTATEPGGTAGSGPGTASAAAAGAATGARSGGRQSLPPTASATTESDSPHTAEIGTATGAGPERAAAGGAETSGATEAVTPADSGRPGEHSGGRAEEPGDPGRPRTVVLRVPRWRRPTVPALVAVLAVVAAVVSAALWRSGANDLADLRADLAGDRRAEEVAGDYALRVSRVEYTDLDGWRRALQSGVGAELAPKLSAAVDVVGPWLAQLEYRATGTLLAAKVTARDGDNYTVAAFVEMRSTSRQTPTGVTATAAYTLTLNSAADWTITDVGGSGLAPAGVPAPGDVTEAPAAGPSPGPPR
ncbi:hypothetical protein [Nocardia carnea]|uniref:hypothetical protein n=1 Tax=Nocardia carnea TaxID=37328 RepID=UPI002454BB90|nr:hypothetical protein [Nocardia carnea]